MWRATRITWNCLDAKKEEVAGPMPLEVPLMSALRCEVIDGIQCTLWWLIPFLLSLPQVLLPPFYGISDRFLQRARVVTQV